VAFVLAYLMKDYHLSLKEAIELVKARRHRARPNFGFFQNLVLSVFCTRGILFFFLLPSSPFECGKNNMSLSLSITSWTMRKLFLAQIAWRMTIITITTKKRVNFTGRKRATAVTFSYVLSLSFRNLKQKKNNLESVFVLGT
jgi:hypothetical protein